ncbi:L,D-transpeptidase family protein [Ectobacillus polymachus]|uniref:L,D-transpeptidase family protein n=1 Tax=Ectobacillus polymachus TaxID=1508806 RepID=UPI003A8C0C8C
MNLWKNKLYLLQQNKVIEEYSISPGKNESPTPVGQFRIVHKSRGWGGGFGSRWLGLNVPWGKYGIHGTNKSWLIGERVSSGCIRMRNKDVERLFDKVPVGTIVQIDGPITGMGKYELKNLSRNSRGNLVQIVQQRLKAAGYYKGPCNGIFDIQTEVAVKKFQKEHHFKVNGTISNKEYIQLGLLE